MSTQDPLQSPLLVDFTRVEDVHLVGLTGSASIEESEDLRAALELLLTAEAPHLVLDLSRLNYITSVGIGTLVAAHHRTRQLGGRLVMVNPTRTIQRLLSLVHIDRLIDTYDTRDAALAAIRKPKN